MQSLCELILLDNWEYEQVIMERIAYRTLPDVTPAILIRPSLVRYT